MNWQGKQMVNGRSSSWGRWAPRGLVAVLLGIVLGVVYSGMESRALGQEDPFALDALEGETALMETREGPGVVIADGGGEGSTFADAFFISKKRVPGSDEARIEWLGSLIIWLLMVMSAASLGLMGMLGARNRRRDILPEGLERAVGDALKRGAHREAIQLTEGHGSFFGRVMHGALVDAPLGFNAMVYAMEQTADEQLMERMRRIEILNIAGQVSPMIGLFGTVYGMILAFQSIVAAGGNADPVLLAGGIGTALTTTFWGLVVAIPALSGSALLKAKLEGLASEAELSASEMINRFRPGKEDLGQEDSADGASS